MPDFLPFLLAIVGGYLLGSIPFGLVLSRAAGIDLRAVGSGNIGATNVLRTGRKDLALATLLLDSFKAGLAVLAFTLLFSRNVGLIAGAAAFFGHCFPMWLKFNGGKGVATYAGLLVFASWKALLVGLPVWLGVFLISRVSSLAALTASILVPVGALLMGETQFAVYVLVVLSVMVFFTHRTNLSRLLAGTEPKFGAKKT